MQVGKSAILARFLQNKFDPSYMVHSISIALTRSYDPTIESTHSVTVQFGETMGKIDWLDTTGKDRYLFS